MVALLQANAGESAANLTRMPEVRQLCAVSGEFDHLGGIGQED